MTSPPFLTRHGFLWFVEYDDNDYSPGTHKLVHAWTFTAAYRKAVSSTPKRDPKFRQLKILRMFRVTPVTVRYWEMSR
jgi:hypothetical protein